VADIASPDEGTNAVTETVKSRVAKKAAFSPMTWVAALVVAVMLTLFVLGIVMATGHNVATACTSAGGSVNVSGGNDDEIVYNYLVSEFHLQPFQASGMEGNFVHESAGDIAVGASPDTVPEVNPDIVNGIGATGIGQWYAGRRDALMNHKFQGRKWNDLLFQLDYLRSELLGSQSGALNAVRSATTIEEATTKFEATFEVSGDYASYPGRIRNAKAILALYGNGAPSGGQSINIGLDTSQCDLAVSAEGLANPFPKGWQPTRLDMGFDGTFSDEIDAPFAGTITFASSSWSNWGGYLEIRANGKVSGLPTRTLFFAEGLIPVVQEKQHVQAGQRIAIPTPSVWNGIVGNIEWGVAQDLPSPDQTGVTDTYAKVAPNRVQMVLDFAKWAVQNFHLGPPTETGQAGYP